MYPPFCSPIFCHLSGNFIIPTSEKFLSFWAKNWSQCLLQSSRELKYFPSREFCKDWNNWKSKVQCLMDKWMNQNFPTKLWQFFPGHQSNMQPCIILMEDYAFSVDWFKMFFVQCCFQLVQLRAVLVVINCLAFRKELVKDYPLPIPPYTQCHLLWMKIGLWCGCW